MSGPYRFPTRKAQALSRTRYLFMTVLMPFQTAKMKLARARFHAEAWAAEPDPPNAERILRSFVRELRAALDSTVVDIARVRSKDPEGVRFPFAENAQQLSDLIDVEIRRIDEDLAAHLKSLKLWPGGNRLYLLHELDHAEAPAQSIADAVDELLQIVIDTVIELGTRFWARP